jgi:hypothetical protein
MLGVGGSRDNICFDDGVYEVVPHKLLRDNGWVNFRDRWNTI